MEKTAGVRGHSGAGLRRFVAASYHRGQTTIDPLMSLPAGTGSATSERPSARLHANEKALPVGLERPEAPLNINGSENDIRCRLTGRKISAGTRSEAGKKAKGAFLGLMKTCAKQGVSFRDHLGDRFKVSGTNPIPNLAEIIPQRQSATV